MYKIEKTDYGFHLTFSGRIEAAEMLKWDQESELMFRSFKKQDFVVLIDMTQLQMLPQDSKTILIDGQKLYRDKGMQKSAVLAPNLLVKSQMTNTARESGILDTERYFLNSDLKSALQWLGIK